MVKLGGRQTNVIAKAKAFGTKVGAKAKLTEGILIKDLMSEYGLSKATVYRLIT